MRTSFSFALLIAAISVTSLSAHIIVAPLQSKAAQPAPTRKGRQ